MKRVVMGILFLVVAASIAHAGFRVPPGVYRIGSLKDAKTRAKKTKRPITFVYTDVETTCPLCVDASLDAMKSLKLRTVVVYAHASNDRDSLPGIVQDALKSSESGRYIPKTVIVDADIKRVIAVIPYAREKRDRSKLFRAAMRKF